jgi:hydroxyacylglutathione hydrolase
MQTLSIQEYQERLDRGETPILIDLRSPLDFAAGHAPGAISVSQPDRKDPGIAELLPSDGDGLLFGGQREAQTFLDAQEATARDRFVGRLDGNLEAWMQTGRSIDMVVTIAADEMAMDLPHDEKILLLDVRTEAEFDKAHVRHALSVPLVSLTDPGSMAILEDETNIYIYGRDASEAVTAASLIKRQGYHNLRALEDDWETIRSQKGIPVEKTAAPLN